MPGTSVLLLSTFDNTLSVTGEKVRADGWFGQTDGLHTIAIHLSNFSGRVFIQASLASDPTESDWFNLKLDEDNPTQEYLEFNHPISLGIDSTDNEIALPYTFKGNFIWIRAKADRSHIFPDGATTEQLEALGAVLGIWMAN